MVLILSKKLKSKCVLSNNILKPLSLGKRVMLMSAQKCGNAPDMQQAGRSEGSQPGDLLGFNTRPVDPKNPESVPVNLTYN